MPLNPFSNTQPLQGSAFHPVNQEPRSYYNTLFQQAEGQGSAFHLVNQESHLYITFSSIYFLAYRNLFQPIPPMNEQAGTSYTQQTSMATQTRKTMTNCCSICKLVKTLQRWRPDPNTQGLMCSSCYLKGRASKNEGPCFNCGDTKTRSNLYKVTGTKDFKYVNCWRQVHATKNKGPCFDCGKTTTSGAWYRVRGISPVWHPPLLWHLHFRCASCYQRVYRSKKRDQAKQL